MNRTVLWPLAAAAAIAAAVVLTATCGRAAPPPPPPAPIPRFVPPLQDAQVGEWLRLAAGVDSELYRVVRAGDFDVDVEVISYHNDQPTGPPRIVTWHRNSFSVPPDAVIRSIDPDRIEEGGRWYQCWRLSIYGRDVQRYYWITDEVPAHGLIKVANMGKSGPDEANAVHLADFGTTEKEK
jgi:hypothetical protein